MIINVLVWCLFGLLAGAVARLLVPGPNRLGCLGTVLLGIAGSAFGGFLGSIIFGFPPGGEFRPAGFIGAVIGAVLILVLARRITPR